MFAAPTTSLARADCTIGLNLQAPDDHSRCTANTARLISLSAAANWREDRVNVNESNWILPAPVILNGNITATITKAKSHGKMSLSRVQCAELHQLTAYRNIEISTSDYARTINREMEALSASSELLVLRKTSPERCRNVPIDAFNQ